MSTWATRIGLDSVSHVLRASLAGGFVTPDTPAVVFHDLSRVRARIAELTERFPPSALHAVAVKANPLVAVLRAAVESGAGLEAAFIEEVHLALAAGCPPPRVIYDSPAKTTGELALALARGVHVNADNLAELDRIAALRAELGASGEVGLRINPLVGAGAIAITSVAARSSKFGVAIDDEALLGAFARFPWLTGLHAHVGSQGCSLEMLVTAARKMEAMLHELNRRAGRAQVTTLDIGGGLPVAYRDEDRPFTLGAYVAALRQATPSLFEPPIRLVTEMGRAIHATAGWAASRVEYVKKAGDEKLAVIHLGADFFVRWVYQPRDWHHDLAVFDPEGREKQGASSPAPSSGPSASAATCSSAARGSPPSRRATS